MKVNVWLAMSFSMVDETNQRLVFDYVKQNRQTSWSKVTFLAQAHMLPK